MLLKVKNKNRYRTAGNFYWFYKDSEGKEYLFTSSQLDEANARASKNPEDCPEISKGMGFWTGVSLATLFGVAVGLVFGLLF